DAAVDVPDLLLERAVLALGVGAHLARQPDGVAHPHALGEAEALLRGGAQVVNHFLDRQLHLRLLTLTIAFEVYKKPLRLLQIGSVVPVLEPAVNRSQYAMRGTGFAPLS